MKYTLHDTFNDRLLSSHRSIETAVRASYRYERAVKRANGESSYIPTEIRCDGERLDENQQNEAGDIWFSIFSKTLRA